MKWSRQDQDIIKHKIKTWSEAAPDVPWGVVVESPTHLILGVWVNFLQKDLLTIILQYVTITSRKEIKENERNNKKHGKDC